MKLRRALVVAAATAAIAPLALLSAPTAFADGEPTSTPSASAPASTPEATPTPTTTPSDTPEPNAATATTTATSTAKSTATSTDTATATATSTATETAEPTDEPSACPVDDDGVDPDSALTLDVSGLPGKVVAGSGWHTFSLTAANHSDQALGDVQWLAAVDNYSESDDEDDWLNTYAQLQYLNPDTKAWESIADEVGNGFFFGETELGAKETVAIKLRVNIGAKAPVGDAYTIGFGGYVDEEKDCVHSAFAYYDFTVLKPGSGNTDPGEAKPGKGDKPAGGKQPQGGADDIPANGSLAETGSSSALPTIGLVGGVAIVAGAGAVFTVRRRRNNGDAAA
jgi:LPXTG-motif cell wall-anchored protein